MITGQTTSTDFPIVFSGGSTYVFSQDVFVTKVDSRGVIVASRYLSAQSSIGKGIAVDSSGNTYVVGITSSANFPVTTGSLITTKPDTFNAGFAVKLDNSLNLVYGTYLGGTNIDTAAAVAVDAAGRAYITGNTNSANFPTTADAPQSVNKGSGDVFVAELNPQGSALVFSTFLGGSNLDSGNAIALDSSANIYVAGSTSSPDFPTTIGAFSTTHNSFLAAAFIAKFNATDKSLNFSTYLGGSNSDSATSLAVNPVGNVFVAGTATSSDFPITPGSLETQRPVGFGQVLFLSELNPVGDSLVYSTYFGTGSEIPGGIALDPNSGLYIAGSTQSPTYPTTASAFQPVSHEAFNSTDGFLTKIDFASPTVCNVTLSSNSENFPGRGGAGSFTFTLASGCPWEITNDSFITLTGAKSGFGNGAVNYAVAQNPSTFSTVEGTIHVNAGTLTPGTNVFTINQAVGSCVDPVFNPSSVSFDASGGIKDISVSLPNGCSWNLANSVAPWITPSNSVNSSGTGTLALYASPNSYSARQGSITVGTKAIQVSQAGGSCILSLNSPSASVPAQVSAGSASFTTGATCGWTANSSVPWIQIGSTSATGQGSSSVSFSIAGNPGTTTRSGTLLIGDQTYTIMQSSGPGAVPLVYTSSNYTSQFSNQPLGDGGPVGNAGVSFPYQMAFDNLGDFYFADSQDARIRRVDTNGIVTTFAGGGPGPGIGDGGPPTAAVLSNPRGVAIDASGDVYIAENSGQRIRKVSNNVISTIAGTGVPGFNGDNQQASQAQISSPDSLVVDGAGNLYFTDLGNSRIRRITPAGIISTVAGTGIQGFGGDGGPAVAAQVNQPFSLAQDTSGNLYFLDSSRVRKISTAGIIMTVAGNGANGATGDEGPATAAELAVSPGSGALAVDASASLYIGNGTIRKVTPDGIIHSIATSGSYTTNGLVTGSSGNLYAAAVFGIDQYTPAPSFCAYTLSQPAAQTAAAGSISVTVTPTSSSCAWEAISTVPWITATTPIGTGTGTAAFTVAANTTTLPRNGIISVGGQAITIVQPTLPANAGIFRSGFFWLLDVDGSRAFNMPPDLAFAYGGVPGDIPITGDWNGNGHTKVGIYRPSNGLFILDTNGDGVFDAGDAVYNLDLGTAPGDVPIVGDWNGDGHSKIGLFRAGYLWILDYNGNGVFDSNFDKTYAYGGIPGDVPVVGDWTGTGASKIGVVRDGFFWILDANGNGTFDAADYVFPFGGIPGDVPVVGDWNGSGTTKVGMFRAGFFWVLDANGNRTFDGTGPGQDLAFAFGGIPGDKPVAGKW